jgi:hypothetical protein
MGSLHFPDDRQTSPAKTFPQVPDQGHGSAIRGADARKDTLALFKRAPRATGTTAKMPIESLDCITKPCAERCFVPYLEPNPSVTPCRGYSKGDEHEDS